MKEKMTRFFLILFFIIFIAWLQVYLARFLS